jgi:predicted RNA-binding Zn ribbon-like protein
MSEVDISEMPRGLGRLCLDLVATVADRRGEARERLVGDGHLAGWLATIGPLDTPPTLGDGDLVQARALREAIYRLVTADGDGARADAELLNQLASHPTPIPNLAVDGTDRRPDSDQTLPAALSVIARDAIDLLGSPQRQRVRTCAAEECGAPFLDSSRPGNRRWCHMGRCGNRAKKDRLRQARREARGAD